MKNKLKELYESGYYLVIQNKSKNKWVIVPSGNLDCFYKAMASDTKIVAIAQKHTNILNAYLADSGVSICQKYQGLSSVDNFIEDYDESINYVLALPYDRQGEKETAKELSLIDLNGCYCEATRVHYDAIYDYAIDNNITIKAVSLESALKYESYFYIEDNCLEWSHENSIGKMAGNESNKGMKQIHLVNNEWEYKEDIPLCTKTKGETTDYINNFKQTLSITDGDKTYEFVKPEFECELLKVVEASAWIIGYIEHKNNIIPSMWTLKGKCYATMWRSEYDLKKIPKEIPWYEIESNFPCLTWCEDLKEFGVMTKYDELEHLIYGTREDNYMVEELRLATNEEIDQLKIKE